MEDSGSLKPSRDFSVDIEFGYPGCELREAHDRSRADEGADCKAITMWAGRSEYREVLAGKMSGLLFSCYLSGKLCRPMWNEAAGIQQGAVLSH
jgi:hypothetical protein